MRFINRFLLIAIVVFAVPAPRPAAWGFDVHRYITSRAIDLLPPELRTFYGTHRAMIIEHSIDPDLWRSAGFEEEIPRHYLDIDAYGAYPFVELPRDYDAAVAKFGKDRVKAEGLVPWRLAEIFDKLVKAFEAVKRGSSAYALDDVKFFSAVISHYVADAHVPFHAVKNHDGQLTGQRGIHNRFETELFRRYEPLLHITPPVVTPITQPRDYAFDAILSSYKLADPLLQADRAAIAGRSEYDDVYFKTFFRAAQPIVERRMGEAIAGVAGVIAGAWQAAGRPALSLRAPYVPRKRPGAG